MTESDRADCAEALAAILFKRYAARRAELHVEPPPLTTIVGDYPEVSLLARKQIERSPVIFNLRHSRVVLEDAIARRFITLVDGTRNLDDLVEALGSHVSENTRAAIPQEETGAQPAPQVTRAQVERNLRNLARLALLVR